MIERRNIPTGTKLGDVAGYSRAVVVGDLIEISATGAVDENGNIVGTDAATQARFIFQKIERVLKEVGSRLEDIVRVRKYIINPSDVDQVSRVNGEFLRNIKPASSMVIVQAMPVPGLLIEIEARAIRNSYKVEQK